MRNRGFPPIADSNSRALILGTFPGPLSLELRQYYAHPRNSFWRVTSDLLGFDPNIEYEKRILALRSNGLALWDVLSSCDREGAADSRIRNPIPNDFKSFFAKQQKIRKVFFNGRKAESLYFRLGINDKAPREIKYKCLPSTSPANARIAYGEKLAAFKYIVE